jgi:type IV pilus assembly protein PilO
MAKGFKDFPPIAQAALLGFLAVLIVGALSYFYVYPLFQQKSDLEAKVVALEADNEKNRAFETKLTEYRNRIAQLQTQLETLRSIVPDSQNTDEFMKTIFTTAGEAAVHVRTFVAQPLVTKDYYMEMPYTIRIDGTYWALVNYFDRLAHAQRIISVTSISLGAPEGGGLGSYEVPKSESVGANCVVTAYFNRAQPAAGATAPKK